MPNASTPPDAATLVGEATQAVGKYLMTHPGRHSLGEVLDAVTTATLPEDAVVLAVRGLIESGQISFEDYQVVGNYDQRSPGRVAP